MQDSSQKIGTTAWHRSLGTTMMNKYVMWKMGEKEKQSDSYAERRGSRSGDTMEVEGQADWCEWLMLPPEAMWYPWPVLPIRAMSGSMPLWQLGSVLMCMAHVTHQMSCRCHGLDCFLKPCWCLRALLSRPHLSLTLGEQVLPIAGSHREWGGGRDGSASCLNWEWSLE